MIKHVQNVIIDDVVFILPLNLKIKNKNEYILPNYENLI